MAPGNKYENFFKVWRSITKNFVKLWQTFLQGLKERENRI